MLPTAKFVENIETKGLEVHQETVVI